MSFSAMQSEVQHYSAYFSVPYFSAPRVIARATVSLSPFAASLGVSRWPARIAFLGAFLQSVYTICRFYVGNDFFSGWMI
jgi:hypothetical protein